MIDTFIPLSILGTEYKLRFLSSDEYPKLKSCEADGLFEPYTKELIINTDMFSRGSNDQVENLHEYQNKVIKHEIIHAFLHESGSLDYAADERLVDLLSIQIDKIFAVLSSIPSLTTFKVDSELKTFSNC